MINLIPNEEKRKMSRDFYLRLSTVFFVMLSAAMFVASIAILPSYFLVSTENNSVNTKLASQEKEPISTHDQDTLTAIKNLKNKLSLVESIQKNKNIFSQKVINEVILKKTPNIKILEISYQVDPLTGGKISVNGKAQSREDLLSFRRALEDDTVFSKVDLPISNFVKGSNIKFYLNLIPS